ncbi:hypothetical protein [Tepidimicrobium xylanilyticum]|uniref:DUF4179 domain-containing protein n=1 Tax=Tepidimicrobium xylanilyticum TaxID=1123352 RepID=A0A1H2Z8G5_9FIRM|nr:hypothetical protein [Tepidimicrobium xylanilyticum]SDX13144.1 hypothetical protein SAMN05660923_01745 [Tepidimicrobium xylanilyticum]
MTDKLRNMLNSIPLPDNLDESINLGFEKGKEYNNIRKTELKRSLIAVAASLTIIISSISIIGLERVEAALKQVLQYVPGYNILVNKDEGIVLTLKEQVYYEEDETFVKIIAASKLDNNLTVSIESNYDLIDNEKVLLKDEKNNISHPKICGKAGGGDFWQGDYIYEVEGEYRDYSLILGNLEIPFTLENAKEVEDFLQLGPYAQDKGISIVAIKKPMDDKIMVSLLNRSKDRKIVDYPFEENLSISVWNPTLNIDKSMYLIDKEGNKTYPTIPSSFGSLMSDFYFHIMDKEGLKLVLPYVKVNYPDLKTEKINIQTPDDGEVKNINKTLNLGDFKINVVDVRKDGDEIIISLKANPLEDEILDDVRIGGISGYGIWFNEDTGFTELFIDKEEAGKGFSIYFESPTTLLLGNWEIEFE